MDRIRYRTVADLRALLDGELEGLRKALNHLELRLPVEGEKDYEETRAYSTGRLETMHKDVYLASGLAIGRKRKKTGQVFYKIVRLFQLFAFHSWVTGNHTVLLAGTGMGKSLVSAICLAYAMEAAPNKEKAFSWHTYPTILLMQEQEADMAKYFKVAAYDPNHSAAHAVKVLS